MKRDYTGRTYWQCLRGAVWCFMLTVFREWNGVRLWPPLAWELSSTIWLGEWK